MKSGDRYRLVVTTRHYVGDSWERDDRGGWTQTHKGHPAMHTWPKILRPTKDETVADAYRRLIEDARRYVDTPSPYYGGCTVELQRLAMREQWETVSIETKETNL